MKYIKLVSEKLSHPFYCLLGAASFGLGCTFVADYDCKTAWDSANISNIAVKVIAIFLTNPWTYIILGLFLSLLNGVGVHGKYTSIENKNFDLKSDLNNKEELLEKEISKNKSLNQVINDYQENIQFLNNQIYDLQNKIAISWLKQAFKQHEINSTERASIYFELNKEFSLLARYSPNPELNEIHRQKFPLNQGVISHAWRKGFCIEDECPNFDDDATIYYDYMSEKYGFTLDQLQKFQMKSCCYVAVAICNVDDHIGVVVFESTDKEILNHSKLQQLKDYCEKYESHLAEFIQNSKALEAAKRMESAKITSNTDSDLLSSLSGGSHE